MVHISDRESTLSESGVSVCLLVCVYVCLSCLARSLGLYLLFELS